MAVWFTSDPHIDDYAAAVKYRGFSPVEEHNDCIRDGWSVVGKRDKVFVLGDVGWNKKKKSLEFFKDLNGFKHLIMGNHDQCSALDYMKVFDKIGGIVKYKEFWLTHAPIHKSELRGKKNLHGHMHMSHMMKLNDNGELVRDSEYINCNVDVNDYKLISYEEIINR